MKRLVAGVALLCSTGGCLSCLGINLPEIPDASAILDQGDGVGNLAAFYDGGTATFGVLTWDINFAGGGTTMVAGLGSGHPFLTLVAPDAYHLYGSGSFNKDDQTDYLYEKLDDGGFVSELEQRDTDGDGIIDQVTTRTWDRSTDLPYNQTDTRYVLQNGAWQQQWSYAGLSIANQQAVNCNNPPTCIGTQGFPSSYDKYQPAISNWPPARPDDGSTTLVMVPGTQIVILQGDPAQGYCAISDAQALLQGFTIGINQMKTCLPTTNRQLGAQFMAGLANPVLVACANTCPCDLATADIPTGSFTDINTASFAWRSTFGEVERISVNMQKLDAQFKPSHPSWAADLAELLVHELMHTGGVNHTPPGSEGCPEGVDPVYGAARYCTGCPAVPLTSGSGNGVIEDAARDCAVASETLLRGECGVDLDVNDNAPGANGSPLNCSCDTSHWAFTRSCDYRQDYGACNSFHKLPFIVSNGDPATQCCLTAGQGMPQCTPDPGCTDGYGHWSQLEIYGGANANMGDCFNFPVGACSAFRQP